MHRRPRNQRLWRPLRNSTPIYSEKLKLAQMYGE
jgi:hypothetical protein